ncbi:MAG: RNA polymerase sigma factor [Candidatus Poribacteria bacterium]|nr:RNA polymerase sigma factor [Candidatus Poribacteria bacterium]
MKNNDIALVHRALAGDDTAFTVLMEKYQKQVHATVWRTIKDFHIAEDIVQETFLKAHQKLGTLKDPHRFSAWLNAIATRRCLAWFREKRLNSELSENIISATRQNDPYSGYLAGEQAQTASRELHEIVKKWLAKLPENERAVITLHYFDGMSCDEIAAFLGVTTNTIKSRLNRARNRLKKNEPLIQSTLDDFQFFATLSETIKTERNITLRIKTTTENGEQLGEGTLSLKRTDALLGLTGFNFGWVGSNPVETLSTTFLATFITPFLLRFPTVIGDTWTQEGFWDSQAQTTLDRYEQIHASAEVFPICLKHKSVFIDTAPHPQNDIPRIIDNERYELDAKHANLIKNLVNGTRYLWFANGIGLVKMRYEHASGLTTETELFEYRVPGKTEESLPMQIGSTYTYKYHNIFRDETVFEKWRVIENF